ncbi:MAG: sensor histidine kinase [Sphingomonas sp.]
MSPGLPTGAKLVVILGAALLPLAIAATIASAALTPQAQGAQTSLLLALLPPLVMWLAAVVTAWLVVDRLLIRPLRQLRARLGGYQPGNIIASGARDRPAASEIRDLTDSFAAISQTVRANEVGLAEGLIRQTRLTREVHHRVKNNLQIISSIINLHARGAKSADAASAYASIQRRVDALAVVHRNHFAELEETRGLSLRPIISDLVANLRAGHGHGDALSVSLAVDAVLVSQDVAVAAAFFITEVVELAMVRSPDAAIALTLAKNASGATCSLLTINSAALAAPPAFSAEQTQRYGRIITGLARQLRSPLAHDEAKGSYAIELPTIGQE